MLPADVRAQFVGHLHGDPQSRNLVEILIDLEEDRQFALDVAQTLKDAWH